MFTKFIKYLSFSAISLLFSIIIFVLINLFFYSNSEDNSDLELFNFYKDKIIQYEAYFANNDSLNLDTNYIHEVLKDHILYTEREIGAYRYYPFLEFTKVDFQSKHINILQDSFDLPRRSIPIVEHLNKSSFDKSIYCIGGSTTFGDLVSDNHTWPSFLFNNLNYDNLLVKNYGVQGYTPTAETILFMELLKLGHRPSLVIFMDGVNTGPLYDGSDYSKGIAQRFKNELSLKELTHLLALKIPLVKFLLKDKIFERTFINDKDDVLRPFEFYPEKNYILVNRFFENAKIRKALADIYNVEIIQFLQPNSIINYDYSLLEGFPKELTKSEKTNLVRKSVQEIYQNIIDKNVGFIDLSHLLVSYKKHAVVDFAHYAPSFNDYLSKAIIENINIQDLKKHYILKENHTGYNFEHLIY